jgi:hypothetical protein
LLEEDVFLGHGKTHLIDEILLMMFSNTSEMAVCSPVGTLPNVNIDIGLYKDIGTFFMVNQSGLMM